MSACHSHCPPRAAAAAQAGAGSGTGVGRGPPPRRPGRCQAATGGAGAAPPTRAPAPAPVQSRACWRQAPRVPRSAEPCAPAHSPAPPPAAPAVARAAQRGRWVKVGGGCGGTRVCEPVSKRGCSKSACVCVAANKGGCACLLTSTVRHCPTVCRTPAMHSHRRASNAQCMPAMPSLACACMPKAASHLSLRLQLSQPLHQQRPLQLPPCRRRAAAPARRVPAAAAGAALRAA